jgi:hypothetical protein
VIATSRVIEQVRRIAAVRADEHADRAALEEALQDVGRMQSWLAASKAHLTSKLAAQVSFPEQTIADCTRGSTRDAIRDKERADTLDAAPSMADALDDARVTQGHVDELTRATKQLDGDQRNELFDRLDSHGLVDIAAVATIEEWRRRLAMEIKQLQRDDGMDRLQRQRRNTRLRSWVDGEGMWCLSARFDPVTGTKLAARLDTAVNTLFAEQVPGTSPQDPIERQRHLAALALARLLDGSTPTGRPGRPEFVVVVDTSQTDGAGGPTVEWPIPVEVPHRILAELMNEHDVHAVVVRNGVVLHAPGDLDLGRSTRLASRAQRRALRALYATCAIPGCSVRFDRCKLHHIIWWRNGGRTDLANLVPVCTHCHSKIHDAGWDIALGPNRELTIRFPDGTVHNTGPPSRRIA